jgi:hypothetical protein
VFLGAAPGVGKTYAMLQAVREQAREGVDILIGVVETHGRQETLALLDKLAIQPRKLHLHRQQRLEEMDLDGCWNASPPSPWWMSWPTATPPAAATRNAGRMWRSCSAPASTSTPPSTCSTWRASTIWCGS